MRNKEKEKEKEIKRTARLEGFFIGMIGIGWIILVYALFVESINAIVDAKIRDAIEIHNVVKH